LNETKTFRAAAERRKWHPIGGACPQVRIRERLCYTTVRCRSMQVRKTSSIGLRHQSSEKISISH